MIKEVKFGISKGLYAIDLTGFSVTTQEPDDPRHNTTHSVRVPAVWFRRRRGVTVACIGDLWDFMRDPKPLDVHGALARMTDGRYGGSCKGRWDGEGYWGSEIPDEAQRHLSVLRLMLATYPAIPPGYDGWWRYETAAEARAVRSLLEGEGR